MRKFLGLMLATLLLVCSIPMGTIAFADGSSWVADSSELEKWQIVTDGAQSKVELQLSDLHVAEGNSVKVNIVKTGAGFGGVKINTAKIAEEGAKHSSVIGATVKGFVSANEADELLVVKLGFADLSSVDISKNQLIDGTLPNLGEEGEFSFTIDFSCLPQGVSPLTIADITLGSIGENNVEFFITECSLVYSDAVEGKMEYATVEYAIDTTFAETAKYMATVAVENNVERSKSANGNAIKVQTTGEGADNFYNFTIPFGQIRNSMNLVNPLQVEFWVYNEASAGGFYEKFSDGDEFGYNVRAYDADGNAIEGDQRVANFVGFRKYVMTFNRTQMAKPELEIGCWTAPAGHTFYVSGFAFIDQITPIEGDKKVDLSTLEVTHFAWPETGFATDMDKVVNADYAHGDSDCAMKIERAETATWAVAQVYFNNFKTAIVDKSEAKNPIAFSFWVYSTKRVPAGDSGITIKYNNNGEGETWDYYWQDENGNYGKTNDLDFVGFRKYTVLMSAQELAYPTWFVGAWGIGSAEIYLSDLSILDNHAVLPLIENTNSVKIVDTNDLAGFTAVETAYSASVRLDNSAIVLDVKGKDSTGYAYVERSLEGIFVKEDGAINLSINGTNGALARIYLTYDDGSGVLARYVVANTVLMEASTEVIIDFSALPYYINANNAKTLQIGVIESGNVVVNITNVTSSKAANDVNKVIYSRAIGEFERESQVNKWTVLKDVNVSMTRTYETSIVKVGKGALRYRFENINSAFSWSQVNVDVEDLISSNTDKNICGLSFWLYNPKSIPAGELGFMIKLIQNDGLEFEIPWNIMQNELNIYNGLCFSGWLKFEMPFDVDQILECDYNDGYDAANPRKIDITKIKKIGFGIWGSYYDYEEGYSCNLVLDDVRLLSEQKLENVLYTITYNLNEGTLPEGAVTSFREGESVELPVPTKDGYVFEGWYTNNSFTGEKVTSIPATQVGNVTLYALWTKTQTSGCKGSISSIGCAGLVSIVASLFFVARKRK